MPSDTARRRSAVDSPGAPHGGCPNCAVDAIGEGDRDDVIDRATSMRPVKKPDTPPDHALTYRSPTRATNSVAPVTTASVTTLHDIRVVRRTVTDHDDSVPTRRYRASRRFVSAPAVTSPAVPAAPAPSTSRRRPRRRTQHPSVTTPPCQAALRRNVVRPTELPQWNISPVVRLEHAGNRGGPPSGVPARPRPTSPGVPSRPDGRTVKPERSRRLP